MKQDCIWPRAILCLSPAQKTDGLNIEALAGLKISQFYSSDISPEITSAATQCYFDITHSQIRAGSPAMIARQVQKKIGARINADVRIGLSVNAPLAQYAASQSLAGIPYVIAPWKISAELSDLRLERLLFIQKSLLQRCQLHGVETVGQLTELDRLDVLRRFGLRGIKLLDLLNGRDYFTHKSIADVASKHITEYLVLPPNSGGRKLILRYIKQLATRLAGVARDQNKFGKTIQLTIFYRKQKSVDFLLAVDGPVNGQYIIKKLAENLSVKNFTEVVLALELKLLNTGHVSGQKELPLECLG